MRLENIKFLHYYDGKKDAYIIEPYDAVKNGYREYKNEVFIYDNSLIVNKKCLTGSILDAVKSLKNTKTPILYNNEDINPIEKDVFITYINESYYQDYNYNLDKIEYIKSLDAMEVKKL